MPFPVIPVIGLAIGGAGLVLALRKPKIPANLAAAATNPNVPPPTPAQARAQAPVPTATPRAAQPAFQPQQSVTQADINAALASGTSKVDLSAMIASSQVAAASAGDAVADQIIAEEAARIAAGGT